MAYNEFLIILLFVVLAIALSALAFLMGRHTGEEEGYKDAYNEGYSCGYLEGVKAGFEEYKEVEASIHEREKLRQAETIEELKRQTEELNAVVNHADIFPPEILLAYGVASPSQLPRDVRDMYELKKEKEVEANGEER